MQQKKFRENCMVCGAELEHSAEPVEGVCVYCGAREQSYFHCPDGHYVCNSCHANEALVKITDYCLKAKSTNPLEMLEELMAEESVAMHGPEHHAMVPGVLVSAYRNATGEAGDKAVLEAIRRGSKVPGGYCGIYGACGAGVGTGVAVAVITGSTPLRAEARALSNLMSAKALTAIAEQGGVRCCKACSRLAVQTAVEFFHQHLNCDLEGGTNPRCSFVKRNSQCNKLDCRYFPKSNSDISSCNV